MLARVLFTFLMFSHSFLVYGEMVLYEFDIDTKLVNFTGTTVEALAIGDQIPAPTIEARVGDVLRATFHNRLDVSASVHWHGVLLPDDQDGVPFLNTQPIAPGQSFTFEFPIIQTGTYWYHSHSDLQVQRGIYGAIILREKDQPPNSIQDEIVLFSDWTDEDPGSVLSNLKKDKDYYAYKKNSVQSWDTVLANGGRAIRNRFSQSFTRMGPMDLADIAYDRFLANGKSENKLIVNDINAEQILLRLINGSTSSYFDVEYAGGPMTIIAADGQDVEPIRVKRLRMSTAETYDVLVRVSAEASFELRATSFDGSGFSSTFVGAGDRVYAPDVPAPNLFLMEAHDMAMGIDMMTTPEHQGAAEAMPKSDDKGMEAAMVEVIAHMTDYQHLVATASTVLPIQRDWRQIDLTLSGNMERYVWSFNGATLREDDQILIRKGENVRIILYNSTMMHHPLHLHGHFFRVVNQHGDRSPLKHTVNVPPMGTVVIEFDANEEKDWLFHCHNQYHMKTGMTRVISYEETSTYDADTARVIQPYLRWFNRSKLDVQSNFLDLDYSLSDERHGFQLEADSNFDDSYEIEATYTYYFSRFFSTFAGVERRKHEEQASTSYAIASYAIAGFNYTLPLLIDSEWRVDDEGEFRVELESELQFTRRLGFDWRWNTDKEYRYRLKYNISKRWAFTLNSDSEYGDGVGMQYLF